jgi:hypothetical protein
MPRGLRARGALGCACVAYAHFECMARFRTRFWIVARVPDVQAESEDRVVGAVGSSGSSGSFGSFGSFGLDEIPRLVRHIRSVCSCKPYGYNKDNERN